MTDNYPRCKTCRFWGSYVGYCNHRELQPMRHEPIGPNYPEYRKQGINGSDTIPMTGPDFGCVHHSELTEDQSET